MSETDNNISDDNKPKTPVSDWILEHVRPHVAWIPDEDVDKDKNTFDGLGDSLEYVKDHIEIGIKFKFKF